MFFIVSKVLGFFASPSNLLIVIGLLGVLMLATRFARAGARLITASILLLGLFGLSPLGNILIQPLEDRFPPWEAARGPPDGIVILGGSIDDTVSPARHAPAINEAAERLTETVVLARSYPQARMIFTGGTGRVFGAGAPEAEFVARFFIGMGLPPDRIALESRSRNTYENALFTKELMQPKPGERWLLVTSGYHMPRSIGIFRSVGFPVEAYPVDWRTRGRADWVRPFDRASEGLRRSDLAIREWVGLAVYWLTGRSAALFPGPAAN
jgi:uncharacterized SAM-binding protein YcdF (DUF218 family)